MIVQKLAIELQAEYWPHSQDQEKNAVVLAPESCESEQN